MLASLERLHENAGGTRFAGTAVGDGGLVEPGMIVLAGPVAIFEPDSGSGTATAEQRLGSLEPAAIRYADPLDAAAAAMLARNGAGELPLDPTLGNAHKIAATEETLLEHIAKGGPVMYPILGLAGAAFLVAILKWIGLSTVRTPSRRRIAELLAAIRAKDDAKAKAIADRLGGPAGRMLQAGVANLSEPRDIVEEVMYETILSTRLRLNRFIPFIAISAAAAPLLGLLGTVTGIINTFKLITVFGSGDVKTLSGGISEALHHHRVRPHRRDSVAPALGIPLAEGPRPARPHGGDRAFVPERVRAKPRLRRGVGSGGGEGTRGGAGPRGARGDAHARGAGAARGERRQGVTMLASAPPAVAVGSDANLLQEAMAIWLSGGWAMVAIAIVALVMFGTATHLWLRLRAKGFASVPERRWRTWVSRPQEGEGPIGGMIRFVTASRSRAAMAHFFEQVNATEVASFSRDLKILKVCVAAAPLLGLLGTVTGMLATFGALATGGGGEKTMAAIAGGISEALITTETGLVIALPGLFLQYRLGRGCEQYRAFLAHLETVCSLHLHHSGREAA